MRRNAIYLVWTPLAITLMLIGCKGPEDHMAGPALSSAAMYNQPVQQPIFEPDPYPTYGGVAAVETIPSESLASTALAASNTQYHTVMRHDTLYGLARSYYGDQRRWKDIFEANRSILDDPNEIRAGQRLLIP